ncbi:hypothetical protein HN51_042084 [Arachis hypogaea]|uniref:Glycosyltransferase N-terminal domain-containing protein n=1 Tax=Arachis hypogaea TaxID=3818 RepID=A0A444YVD5_ARAHY|nr:7-deoxyloganetin glucosyltransferase [Arachis hypogaea]RYR05899.1 hypothetical protein Ahy_B06g085719 [Arachis hypogaea]
MVSWEKPHAVLIPYPAQGHINPTLKLAKLLHHKGFHITFVNTEYNHNRLLKSRGSDSLKGLSSFQFETIPDGLPVDPNHGDATQDIPSLCKSTTTTCLPHLKNLILKLNDQVVPGVSCIVCDAVMSFGIDAAQELEIPVAVFWTASASSFTCCIQYSQLLLKGLVPLKDSSYLTNGYLETTIDWVPGIKEIRLRDIPSFIRTTDPNDIMLNFFLREMERSQRACAIIINTFDALEGDILEAFSSINSLPPVYSIGPMDFLLNHITDHELNKIGSNLWKEDQECIKWLDKQEPNSVVYINFGSITTMTNENLIEFAWGIANCNKKFLWVIRPDLVAGENAILPNEFHEETKVRGILSNWCPQEEVLAHPSVGVFLTHSGWNSTLESVCNGVTMICWPFFSDQMTNCRFSCNEWGIGLEIEDVKREKIESLVRESMDGEMGQQMKENALKLTKLAKDAASDPNGSSFQNLDKVIHDALLSKFAKN